MQPDFCSRNAVCKYGTGFKGSTYMTLDIHTPPSVSTSSLSCTRPLIVSQNEYTEYDTPNLIMTYTSILSLAILRDDLSRLDRKGVIQFVKACQHDDGRYVHDPS